ncbi:hypothetical protein Tco_0561884 [Tanacetum coccineum]
MSRSEPEEMAPKRSKPVVILKFDMHIYTFTLTLKELNQAIKEFFIPMDLRHRLPPPDLTMNKLLNDVIGIYIEQLDQGRMGIPLFLFRDPGHWFSFENKSGGRAKKCFKEITSSLKGWKKKFFLIDMRAIPKAMTWRHIDTDVRDDFLISYHKSDADRIAKRVILLHKPRHPLLYMCGLTMDFRHSELSHNLPHWNGTLVSKGNSIPDNEHLPVRTITPLAVGYNLFKANSKRAGEGSSVSLKKKRARKNAGPIGSEFEGTIFAAPINQCIPKPLHEVGGLKGKEVETPIVNLSDHTRELTPPLVDKTSEEQVVHEDDQTRDTNLADAHSFHSIYKKDNDEDADDHRFVPEWGLKSDLRISFYRACKEINSQLATPPEDEVLCSLTNYEVVRCTYQSLGQSMLSQVELLKRYEKLNRDHLDLYNRSEDQLKELNRMRTDCQGERQSNEGLSKNLVLLESAHAQCSDGERELTDRLKDMERERDDWIRTASYQVERIKKLEGDLEPKFKQLDRVQVLEEKKARLMGQLAQSDMASQSVVRDLIPTAICRLLTSVKYRKSLAVPIGVCYIAGWLGGLSLGHKEEEVAAILPNTSNLDIEGSKVSPDLPSTIAGDQSGSSTKQGEGNMTKPDSQDAHLVKTFANAPLNTTA